MRNDSKRTGSKSSPRLSTLFKRVDEGGTPKILIASEAYASKPGSVTRSMMNEDQERIHYDEKYYN